MPYIMHKFLKPGDVSQMFPVDYIRYTIRNSISTYGTLGGSPLTTTGRSKPSARAG